MTSIHTDHICGYMHNQSIICSITYHTHTPIVHILIESDNRPSSGEISVIVIKMFRYQQPMWVLDMVMALISHLRSANWMSKSVLLLLVPISDCSDSNLSASLEDWLFQYHNGKAGVSYNGLLRGALVLDLVAGAECSSSPPPISWDGGYELRLIGTDGDLPNMDMVSAPLSMFSDHLYVVGGADDFLDWKRYGRIGEYLERLW
eukprot:CAMPEP_0185034632 /NCGR_PEP_ID=MMETSP1103-20130426/24691_1 /TAXON_ID=36769 /ORGANISM="Paraphysomonas bandaiensis, Strain Caron Lab Isolate" /LENGTH=203 /DNA_ID=CAMNT_0027571369 /DNA_START=263 /DNA_END=871 /DNA_ORIENTATION=-